MSAPRTAAFHGLVRAVALIVDPSHIGEAEARRRVVDRWRPGVDVRLLPGGAWLVLLAEPLTVRAEHAPGTPLVETDGHGLVQPGLDVRDNPPADGELVLEHGGRVQRLRVAELPVISPQSWVRLADLTRHELLPLDPPEATLAIDAHPGRPAIPELATVDAPDLRTAIGLDDVSARAAAAARALGATGGLGRNERRRRRQRRSRKQAMPQGRHSDPGRRAGAPSPLLGRGGSRATRPPRARQPLVDRLANLALRGPTGALVRNRHQRYLHELTAKFTQQRWDEALRDAIGLGDRAGDWSSVRLPGRRTGQLSPTPQLPTAGATVSYGTEVVEQLRSLYRYAVEQLEREGRVVEAAFVLADLLGATAEAVGLLERHQQWRLAAELAEGRELGADLVVRLWWQAGDRDRAVAVAITRGAFATAVDRLAQADQTAADELREVWVAALRQAGDRLGAVAAAWPLVPLRRHLVEDLQAVRALGGAAAGTALAYLLALPSPTLADATAVRRLLDSDDLAAFASRQAFVGRFSRLPASEPATDRELSTAAVTLLARDAAPTHGATASVKVMQHRLLPRTDPLLRADLPAPAAAETPPSKVVAVTGVEPGHLPVWEATPVTDGSVLVACGEAGVRLLSPSGGVRARWDVPAHRLVLADHGGSALLAAHRGAGFEVHRLDLADRRVRYWAGVRAQELVGSFDGAVLLVVTDDGLDLIDATADRPRVLWRELDAGVTVLSLARSATSLTALVTGREGAEVGVRGAAGGEGSGARGASAGMAAAGMTAAGTTLAPGRTEVWRWELPGMTLRSRVRCPDDATGVAQVLAPGDLLLTHRLPGGQQSLVWHTPNGQAGLVRRTLAPDTPLLGADTMLLTDADTAASGTTDTGETRVDVLGWGQGPPPQVSVRFPTATPSSTAAPRSSAEWGGPSAPNRLAPRSPAAYLETADRSAAGIRVHEQFLTVWESGNRIVTIDRHRAQLVSALRTVV